MPCWVSDFLLSWLFLCRCDKYSFLGTVNESASSLFSFSTGRCGRNQNFLFFVCGWRGRCESSFKAMNSLPAFYDRGKSVLQTHNLRETVLSVLQTHTTYPSFRETFLGALHASAHVLLVACSPHVARHLRNRLLPGQTQDQLTKNHRYFCRELANSHRPI